MKATYRKSYWNDGSRWIKQDRRLDCDVAKAIDLPTKRCDFDCDGVVYCSCGDHLCGNCVTVYFGEGTPPCYSIDLLAACAAAKRFGLFSSHGCNLDQVNGVRGLDHMKSFKGHMRWRIRMASEMGSDLWTGTLCIGDGLSQVICEAILKLKEEE